VAGFRNLSDGSLYYVGSFGSYWSSTVNGTYAFSLAFISSADTMINDSRAFGSSVRCLKD
jgi:hypothetical protein